MKFSEIIKMSVSAIKANKLRSILTLIGIIVGIFSIIGVMTALEVLQKSLEEGLSGFGAYTFKVDKHPVLVSHEKWQKARKWKDITYEQAKSLKERLTLAEYVGIEDDKNGQTVKYKELKTNPNIAVIGAEPEVLITNNLILKDGRNINDHDLENSNNVTILADQVAKKLFPQGDFLNKEIKIGNYYFKVIGLLEPKGGALTGNNDNFVIIPLTNFLKIYGKQRSLSIMVKAKSPEQYDECLEEARWVMRSLRNVPLNSEDDFAIYSNDSMIATVNDFTIYIKIGIACISLIALIAAGIGVMNIMLVSVTERTKEIGIRKALGAKRANILAQFIAEAIILCQMGGIVGIVFGVVVPNIAAIFLEFPPVFPLFWAFMGMMITTVVGVIFGVYPAWKASNLDPIDSLRYE